MPTPIYASPFPSLDLTLEEKEQLLGTADELLDQVTQKFEDFLWRDKGRIDPAKWALVKERENLRCYHDRRPGGGTGDSRMHQLLTTGTIVATLNDAMYGELNHTTEAIRIKTANVKDGFIDCAVLETILEPTVDEPFRSTTVGWFVRGVPMLVRAMTKHLDALPLESTGMRRLSNGEMIGYRVVHSVAFAKAPPLSAYERCNVSTCTLWRALTPTTVQVFITSYLDINDSFMAPFLVKTTAETLIAIWKITQNAQMKKLAWLVKNKSTFADGGRTNVVGEGCSVCGSKDRSARKGIKSACAICSHYTCKSCRVKRELCTFSPDGQLTKHPTSFCLPCVMMAAKLDAAVIARDEVLGRANARGGSSFDLTTAIAQATGMSPALLDKFRGSSGESMYSGSYQRTWSSSASSVTSRTKSTARSSSNVSDVSSEASFGGIII